MFNSESTNIFTHNVKRLVLNSCVAFRKPLIREANPKKGFHFDREHKDWSQGQRENLMWPEAPIIPTAQPTSLQEQCFDLG